MKKVSIIYWSNGGNVETIANAIHEGANEGDVEVETKHVVDASLDDVLKCDAIAFGSPSVIKDDIEEREMRPFINKVKSLEIKDKPLVLFGSCGWRDRIFIDRWGEEMKACGFNLVGKLVIKDSVEKEDVKIAKELGRILTK